MNDNFVTFEENLINWYPFSENSKILIIENTNKEILNIMNQISKQVKSITLSEVDKLNEFFDYIILFSNDVEIKSIEKNLKKEGKLLIIADNDFGISSFSNANREGKLKIENAKKNVNTIIEKLYKNGFIYQNVFLCFPNKENVELIINAKQEIDEEKIEKYIPQIPIENIKIFDEVDVLKNMIKYNKKLFNQMGNTYLIETSKQNNICDICYVSFNNCRKKQYRLITRISSDRVEKISANEEAKLHIEEMKENIKILREQQIELLDYVEGDKLYSKLEKNEKTLANILAQYYNNLDIVVKILNDMKRNLLDMSISYEKIDFDKTRKAIKNMDEKDKRKLHFLEDAFWDMIPKNCFLKNNKYMFFDQEWREKYLPVEFIIYRSIINSYELIKKIDVNELFDKLEIQEYIKTFEILDEEIRNEIIDDEIYINLYKKENKAIDNLINDNTAYKCNDIKQNEYIKSLEKDNIEKQKYIEVLEKQNEEKEKVIKEFNKNKKNFFNI